MSVISSFDEYHLPDGRKWITSTIDGDAVQKFYLTTVRPRGTVIVTHTKENALFINGDQYAVAWGQSSEILIEYVGANQAEEIVRIANERLTDKHSLPPTPCVYRT
ncbi:hypothetical protein HY490_02635 [Candidatus Woesearchaeota archaeon]|nr:hypothetical protein [Candidatus Woesearchaeota archaeon]